MLLVVGNAATADGLVRARDLPSAHDVGVLAEVAGGDTFWMPGGSAPAIAIAAARQTRTRLAHPLPAPGVSASGEQLRAALEAFDVDISACPDVATDVRALVVEVPEAGTRLMWSEPGAPFDPDAQRLLADVTHVVFAPRWGAWSQSILSAAVAAGIPCSIIGEIPPVAHRWAFAVADHRQMAAAGDVSADIAVTTAGSHGANARTAAGDIHIDAVPTEIVDTTGAGDSFGGTLIGASVAGSSLEQAGVQAAQAAATQCTRWGAIPTIAP